MEEGLVVQAFNQWYEVRAGDEVLLCQARGRLRQERGAVLTGDHVLVTRSGSSAVIEQVLPRRTRLVRPPVANATRLLAVVTLVEPEVSREFLDRMIVAAAVEGVNVAVVINKLDLVTPGLVADLEDLVTTYKSAGFPCVCSSVRTGAGVDDVRRLVSGRVAVLAGPSGVGKSSLVNALTGVEVAAVGTLAPRTERGRHTTRHVRLLECSGGWIADTPGYVQLDVPAVTPAQLQAGFPEIAHTATGCRFRGCEHDAEPDCAVRDAVGLGSIHSRRYRSYLALRDEIKRARPRRR